MNSTIARTLSQKSLCMPDIFNGVPQRNCNGRSVQSRFSKLIDKIGEKIRPFSSATAKFPHFSSLLRSRYLSEILIPPSRMAEADPPSLVAVVLMLPILSSVTKKFEDLIMLLSFGRLELDMLEKLRMVQMFLRDISRQRVANAEAFLPVFKRFENFIYDADDVFDELIYIYLTDKRDIRRRVGNILNEMNVRRTVLSKLNEISMSFEVLHNQISQFFRHARDSQISRPIATANRVTDSLSVDPNGIGRENDARKIVVMLMSQSRPGLVSVLPIVGMGGIGKTALAQLVYNDQHIQAHFSKMVWLSVGYCDSFPLFVELIWESLDMSPHHDSMEAMALQISEILAGHRCLLVLDDLWGDNFDHCPRFLTEIARAAAALCVLVTTRSMNAASLVGNLPPYVLEPLTDNECWLIFKAYAFGSREAPLGFESMREEIAGRCRGLPLVAALAGSMSQNKGKDDCLSILERYELENVVLQTLQLSFDNLPSPSLKKCFAYCSIFTKGSIIEKEQLIQLWMAEGFLEILGNQQEEEDMGEQFFEYLVQNLLLQEKMLDKCGNVTHCMMHDLLHDLAQSISRDDILHLGHIVGDTNFQTRYRALNSFGERAQTIQEHHAIHLRTFFSKNNLPENILSGLKNLRVLNLCSSPVHALPIAIDNLIHLRFLDLSESHIEVLPDSLCALYNLQTLRVSNCSSLKMLPKKIVNLINLRHLLYYIGESFQMPPNMGRLTSLRTLLFFNLGEDEGRRITELGYLKHLRGKLEIRKLESVNNKEEAQRADLSRKLHVYKLEYHWSCNRDGSNNDEKVLEGLEPHPDLKSLTVDNFMGDKFPSWVMNMTVSIDNNTGLSKLMELRLINCKRCETIPILGQLPSLKYLELKGLVSVKRIGLSFYGLDDSHGASSSTSAAAVESRMEIFPALKSLTFENMPNLTDWMEAKMTATTGVEVFPCLEKLAIQHCPRLKTTPVLFPTLKELKVEIPFITKNCITLPKICSNLTTLMKLDIYGLTELTCLPDAVLHNNLCIKCLSISCCPNLTHIVPTFRECGNFLQELFVHGCENLRELPDGINRLQCLLRLYIDECPNLQSFPIESGESSLTSLKYLRLAYCDALTKVPGRMFESASCLESLTISHCPNLTPLTIDLSQLTSLSSLWIVRCPNLTIPEGLGLLSSLRELQIGPFASSLQFDPLQVILPGLDQLRTLHSLGLYGWPQCIYLPDQLQEFFGLKIMHLNDFGVKAVPDWLGNLSSLEELGLYNCKKLECLPSAEAMRGLTNLRRLSIINCPLLEKRCVRNNHNESERPKILRIREVLINFKQLH